MDGGSVRQYGGSGGDVNGTTATCVRVATGLG